MTSQDSTFRGSVGLFGVAIFEPESLKRALGVPEFDLERPNRAIGVSKFDERVIGAPKFDLERLKRFLVPRRAREGSWPPQHSILNGSRVLLTPHNPTRE